MTISLISAHTPKWDDNSNTAILLTCRFSHFPDEDMPFRAVPDDAEEHGRNIFTRAAAGEFGVPAPYVKPQAEIDAEAVEAKNAADSAAAKQYAKLTSLKAMSPAEVQTWVAANVTNLAQAQDAIATLAIAVSILSRRI